MSRPTSAFPLPGFRRAAVQPTSMPTAGESRFFEGRGTRVFLDPQPSCVSPVAELVRSYPIHSRNVIAHIRKATQGAVALENTHPFQRELWGRYWIFAHNGNLTDFLPPLDGSFTPVGQTDSERAFCWLLQNLRQRFGSRAPSQTRPVRRTASTDPRSRRVRGACNYLLSNGDCLFAHCSTQLSYIIRQAPFAVAHLRDQDLSIDFSDGDDTGRSRRSHCHRATDRQRVLDDDAERESVAVRRRGAGQASDHHCRARQKRLPELSGRSGIRLAVRLLLRAKPLDCRIHLLGDMGVQSVVSVERRFRKQADHSGQGALSAGRRNARGTAPARKAGTAEWPSSTAKSRRAA
jgi:predicted glutamine amidotransferase